MHRSVSDVDVADTNVSSGLDPGAVPFFPSTVTILPYVEKRILDGNARQQTDSSDLCNLIPQDDFSCVSIGLSESSLTIPEVLAVANYHDLGSEDVVILGSRP